MKLILYLKHFPPCGTPLRVGTNKAVDGLAAGLVANGAQVTVLCEGEKTMRYQAKSGYEIACFKTSAPYRSFQLAPSLKDYIENCGSETLAVLNGIFHPAVFAVSRVLGRRGIPYVVAPHGPYHPFLFSKSAYLKWPYWYLIERRLLNGARAIQFLDRRHALWSNRLGVQSAVVEAPNGYTESDVPPEETLRWHEEGRIKMLYWGRLAIHVKGLDILLSAFASFVQQTEAELTIQGPDWRNERSRLEALIRGRSKKGFVEIRNPIFETPAPQIMMSYDIVVMPSRFEGFGLAALEAMLAARVVLVPESAGIAPHVLASGCGVVVKPTEASIMQGLLALLSCRSQWKEMGRRGRHYALQNLHWNRIADSTLQQYEQLISLKGC